MSEQTLLQQMIGALKTEREIYLRMLACSQEQEKCLEEKPAPVERIVHLMQEKVELAAQVEQLETENRAIKTDWETHYEEFPEEERVPLAELKDDMMNTLLEMQSLENKIAAGIQDISAEIMKELSDVQKHKNVSQAYVPKPGPQRPHYFDQKN